MNIACIVSSVATSFLPGVIIEIFLPPRPDKYFPGHDMAVLDVIVS